MGWPPVHRPVAANWAPWQGHAKLPLTMPTVHPKCGQISENAANVVAPVRTAATGVPCPESTRAMPPTVPSAGYADTCTARPELPLPPTLPPPVFPPGAVESLPPPHAVSRSAPTAASAPCVTNPRRSILPATDVRAWHSSHPARMVSFGAARITSSPCFIFLDQTLSEAAAHATPS